MEWRDIATAPKDKPVDVWAKKWLAHTDRFTYRRFPNCWWWHRGSNQALSSDDPAHWMGLDEGWRPTHWMPLPDPPKAV